MRCGPEDECGSSLPVVRTVQSNVVEMGTVGCETARGIGEGEMNEGGNSGEGEGGGEGEVGGEGAGGCGGGGGGGGRMLWEGEYDEKASARSFQEALAEWRAGRVCHKTGSVTGW